MVRLSTIAAVAAFATATAAQQAQCGPNNPCPADTPCCSTYGQCGVGAYCLGGCDPKYSHSLDSCVPAPVCQSKKHTFENLDNVVANTKYLGDNSKADWVSSGKPVPYDGTLLMTMAQDTVGTLLATTEYVWYGKISTKMTTSGGKGVVTAFIMMSDVKDEIDYEWVGADTSTSQTNYYYQGVTVYTNSKNLSSSDTRMNEHEYTIDWSPDRITWAIDGQIERTLEKKDTYNDTAKAFYYPQTPARVMLSLWPAGLPSNAEGTINWAGGVIDWNDQQHMQNGYYYARVREVNVECYEPPSDAKKEGSKSYKYTNANANEQDVLITDDHVTLASFRASGDRPDYDPDAAASSAGVKPTETAAPETVPGMSGQGSHSEEQGELGQNADGGSSGGSSDGTAGTGFNGGTTTFSQGGNGQGGVNAASQMGGSMFAILVAVIGLLFL